LSGEQQSDLFGQRPGGDYPFTVESAKIEKGPTAAPIRPEGSSEPIKARRIKRKGSGRLRKVEDREASFQRCLFKKISQSSARK
jgi:hypothetical protein